MTRLDASSARKQFSETVNRVAYGRERIVLHRRGRDVAAMVSMDDLRLLEELEDRCDAEAARKALASTRNRKRVTWAKVKQD